MKNAPNLKYQPKDKFTEVIIFAGTDAYVHAQHWIESEGRKHGDNVPPVYLGPKQLADLANIRIVDDERRFARVYIAGEIEPIQINTIAEKLALAGVQEAKLYKGITDQEPENWRDYLQRIREQAEREEMLTDEQYSQRKTTLPMSIGSEGYDSQLSYVVKGVIPANSLCSTYGASGSYKSFLACSWACHVATGIPWGGRRVVHGAVMYVVGEGGIGVPRRIKAWELVNSEQVKNLYLVNRPIFPAA
ncbi:TPA: ATP-binding protein, partial [Escherichia coli]